MPHCHLIPENHHCQILDPNRKQCLSGGITCHWFHPEVKTKIRNACYLCMCLWRLDNWWLCWLNHTLNLELTAGQLNHGHWIPTQRHLSTIWLRWMTWNKHIYCCFSQTAFLYIMRMCVHKYIINSTCAICDMWEAVIVVGMAIVWDSEPLLLFWWTSSIATVNEHWDRFWSILNGDVMLSTVSRLRTHIKGFWQFFNFLCCIRNTNLPIEYLLTIEYSKDRMPKESYVRKHSIRKKVPGEILKCAFDWHFTTTWGARRGIYEWQWSGPNWRW